MNNCSPSDSFATTTPADYPIVESFGYTTNGKNFPGLLGLTFLPSSTIAGYSITGQTSLLSVSFPNLIALPATAIAPFSISTNVAMTNLSVPVLSSVAVPITINGNTVLTQVNFPALVSGPTTGTFNIISNPALTSILFPLLSTTTAALSFTVNPLLATVNLASLVSVSGVVITGPSALTSLSLPLVTTISPGSATGLLVTNNASLTTFSAPNWIPTNTRQIVFTGSALSQASVDHILARAVANPSYVSGVINLSGGTNAAPGVQGQLDKATLIARGCTVTTN